MQKIFDYRFLILILILGVLLRVVALNQLPPALNWDEVSHGYNAYSILKTGHDQWGQLIPVANFRAYGDYPLPLNLYLTIPFVFVFGLTEIAIRLPHALLGTLTIVSVYFFVAQVTKNKTIGLIASFLTAIEPWFLFPSRAVFQSNLSVFFLISFAALFFNREKHKVLLPLSFLSLGLTLFSYHSTRIFVPLLLCVVFVIYFKEIIKSKISIILIILFFLPMLFVFLNPEARARSSVVFLLDQAAINKIENLQNNSDLPLKRLVYNKVTYFSFNFAKNYINYFSPDFLFINGGTQYQFSVPKHGVLYLFTLPLFYLGLIFVFKKSFKDKNYKFLLIWLFLAPIPAAITLDKNAVIRATTILPIPEILIAFGLYKIVRRLQKYQIIIAVVFVATSLFSLENYLGIYANSYKKDYSWSWQYGYKEAIDFVQENQNEYDNIIVTKAYGEPHEYFLFYLKQDPQKYLSDISKIAYYQSNWWWVDKFDKYWFLNDWQIKDLTTESKLQVDCKSLRCLLITTPNNAPAGFSKIKEIKFLDGKAAFEIYNNYLINQ